MKRGGEPSSAVVLSGGGAYAAYEVGVMKALFTGQSPTTNFQPLDPDMLVGTAAGAMNAMAILAHDEVGLVESVARLENVWLTLIAEGTGRCGNGIYRIRGLPFEFFDPNCIEMKGFGLFSDVAEDAARLVRGTLATATEFLSSRESLMQRSARALNLSAFVSAKPFLESVNTFIPLGGVRRSPRYLRIVATDLNIGKLTVFTERDVDRYGYAPLLASTALPAIFPPVDMGGDNYIDGSTLAHTPLLPAIAEAETLHVIYMDPDLANISPERLQGTVNVLDRTFVVHFAFALNRDILLANEINQALDLIERGADRPPLSSMELHAFLRMASRIYRRLEAGRPYRRLTIHRYHPRDDLGEDLGLMNLSYDKVRRVIERGYQDAVQHDCVASGCVTPPAPVSAAKERDRGAPIPARLPSLYTFRTPDPAAIRAGETGTAAGAPSPPMRTPTPAAVRTNVPSTVPWRAGGPAQMPQHDRADERPESNGNTEPEGDETTFARARGR
jgi:predicted acylesterase/phospholipase RssA